MKAKQNKMNTSNQKNKVKNRMIHLNKVTKIIFCIIVPISLLAGCTIEDSIESATSNKEYTTVNISEYGEETSTAISDEELKSGKIEAATKITDDILGTYKGRNIVAASDDTDLSIKSGIMTLEGKRYAAFEVEEDYAVSGRVYIGENGTILYERDCYGILNEVITETDKDTGIKKYKVSDIIVNDTIINIFSKDADSWDEGDDTTKSKIALDILRVFLCARDNVSEITVDNIIMSLDEVKQNDDARWKKGSLVFIAAEKLKVDTTKFGEILNNYFGGDSE